MSPVGVAVLPCRFQAERYLKNQETMANNNVVVEKKKRQADRRPTQDIVSGSRAEEAGAVQGDWEAVLEDDPNAAKRRRIVTLLMELRWWGDCHCELRDSRKESDPRLQIWICGLNLRRPCTTTGGPWSIHLQPCLFWRTTMKSRRYPAKNDFGISWSKAKGGRSRPSNRRHIPRSGVKK